MGGLPVFMMQWWKVPKASSSGSSILHRLCEAFSLQLGLILT